MAHLVQARHPWSRERAQSLLSAGSVLVEGESLYYAASGLAESGAAILFLHETGGSGVTWAGQLSGLAQKARCLVPDLPGHGQSEGMGHRTVADYRRAVLGFLDALAIEWPVVIAGVCLGASIAVDLALHAPHRVAGLVLAGLNEGGRATLAMRQFTARGEAPAQFVKSFFSETVSPRLLEEQLKRWRKASPIVRDADIQAVADYSVRDGLRRLSQRVLLIGGGADPVVPPSYTAELAREIAHGEASVIPEAGGLSMLERPEQFNRLVGAFAQETQPVLQPLAPALAYCGGYRR